MFTHFHERDRNSAMLRRFKNVLEIIIKRLFDTNTMLMSMLKIQRFVNSFKLARIKL